MDTNGPSGLNLKVERVASRVTARRLAIAMGVSPSRISAIEREQFISDAMVARYRAALATCAPSSTSAVA